MLAEVQTEVQRSAISWRSVTLGFLGVLLICIITPYNDFVLSNTYVVGNSLPLGAMLLFFTVAVFLNAPLSRYMPRKALTSGELGVAFAMVLVGCALPSSALMRYLPASLVYPFWQARSNPEALKLLESVHLPRWLYPTMQGNGPAQWMNDPVVTGYQGRWTGDGSPPYLAWVTPMITWGIFVALLYGALMFLFAILRRQWFENERLPFPLATIELALVEAPEPRKWLNTTMRTRAFWICFALVFFIHGVNAMYAYWPKYFPEIPVRFDLNSVFSEVPWKYMDGDMKKAKLYMTAAGVAYFLPNAVSFSMWFFYVAWQVYKMMLGAFTGDPGTPGAPDEMFGGMFAYLFIVIWIGRQHWVLVARQAFRGVRPGEPQGRYLSYPTAFWGLVACTLGMVLWLTLAGATIGGAVVLALTVIAGLFMVARIVAETGLLQPGSTFMPTRPWTFLGSMGWTRPTSVDTVFLAGHLQNIHHDVRESFGVFGTHAMKITDQTVYEGKSMLADDRASRRHGKQLLALFAVVLAVAYVTSFSSMLWNEYNYGVQKNPTGKVVNDYASDWAIVGHWTNPTLEYANKNYNYSYSPPGHFGAGAAITVFLSVMRLRYTWWPLHPVGFLTMSTWPMSQLWFAIFVGWLVKAMVLKYGGAKLYVNARPAMIGVIVGEAVAAGFWLVMAIVISSMGYTSKIVRILPE
jgi:Family of unknown function (DUF6785)/Domain of unknown function (DUF6784)